MDQTQDIIDHILKNEGGFQDDPDDTGNYADGELIGTNYGITPAAYTEAFGKTPTKEDIQNLTEEQAAQIYRMNYISKPKIDQLPEDVQSVVADMAVNAGPARAIKILQEIVGATPDGVIGPQTLSALSKFDSAELRKAYVQGRISFYEQLAQADPKKAKYLKGWTKRARSFL